MAREYYQSAGLFAVYVVQFTNRIFNSEAWQASIILVIFEEYLDLAKQVLLDLGGDERAPPGQQLLHQILQINPLQALRPYNFYSHRQTKKQSHEMSLKTNQSDVVTYRDSGVWGRRAIRSQSGAVGGIPPVGLFRQSPQVFARLGPFWALCPNWQHRLRWAAVTGPFFDSFFGRWNFYN